MSPVPPIPASGEFSGKVAVVTGGSNGIGAHLVRALGSLGAETFFCGTDASRGEAVGREAGPGARFFRLDLKDPAATREFVRKAGEHRGRIDYLVSNAAIDPRSALQSATDGDFDRLIAVNLKPCFVCTQAALPYLEAGAGKAIVNVGTTSVLIGHAENGLYNAAKAGLIGFTRSFARELGPKGIRVNMVSPGWIMTSRQLAEHVTEEDKAGLLRDQSLKSLLGEEHVTPAILFLLSCAAAGITGQELVVDGGKVMF